MHRISLSLLLVSVVSSTQAADKNQKGLDFFEAKIRPVLIKHCYQCHSAKAAAAKTLKGGLLVDSRNGLRKGGESGPAVVPGKPEESLILDALRHESFKMPPKSKLPDSIVGHFVQWIELGAPDPRHGKAIRTLLVDLEAGRKHWAFQPLRNATPPQIDGDDWSRTPVDQFLRARQLATGVSPNGPASPRTLIRRAYFDLVGLPPAPEAVEAFVVAAGENGEHLTSAYEALVDELLKSPHYGERWARHWLDLVRFAESNGYAFDKDRPFAFEYRDWVIRSLNEDLPYDQFVRWQIAGDLLADAQPATAEAARESLGKIAATGFLVAGPFTTQQTQKERERSRYEQLDDMIHTLGSSLLGLTVGCARCHTHKYDPLPIHDYYQLASCFADVGFTNAGVNAQPAAFRAAQAKYNAEHKPLADKLAAFEKEQLPARFEKWLVERPESPPVPRFGEWRYVGPFAAANFNEAHDKAFPPEKEIDLTKTYNQGKLKWTPQPSWKDGAVYSFSGDNSANYLFREIHAPAAVQIALSLGSDDSIKLWVNGVEALNKKVSRGAAADQEKVTISLKPGRNELLMKIVNGGGGAGFYFKSLGDGVPPAVAKLLETPTDKWNDKQRRQVLDWFRKQDDAWKKLNVAVEEHKKKAPKPQLRNVYSAKTRGSTYNFGGDTYKVYHLRRGNVDNKQSLAEPGFLRVLMRNASTARQRWLQDEAKPIPARIALSDWLTDAEHGAGHLLARVIVNRLWRHHFGRGLVATPNDFGARGERPTHPELLDWLAAELIRGGWRLKPIHRLIATSAAYMQGNQEVPAGMKLDPGNRLLWRRSSRRLEAEAIRDALLAISGTLDRRPFGKGSLDQKTPRRSVYLTVKRSQLIPVLQLFDAPDAMQGIGSREESTVAPQALAMLNSPFVRDLANKLAKRVRNNSKAPDSKTSLAETVSRAYRTALSRPATEAELQAMTAFVKRQATLRGGKGDAEAAAFRDFCHVLLCMNEFIYID